MSNKINLPNIEAVIKKGLMKGYKENILLQSSYNSFHSKVAEYLLTICIAQSLLIWNDNQNEHSRYKIFLEYPSKDFINNAFLSSKLDSAPSVFNQKIVNRQNHKPFGKPKGRIDIVIAEENILHIHTKVGIEVKAINKTQKKIISDINRLVHAMVEEDNIGENNIIAGYSVFLENLVKEDNIVSNERIEKIIEKTKKKWTKILENLDKIECIEYSMELLEVEKSAEEDVRQSHKEQESDYEAVARDTGLVLGVLIKILRVTDD